MPLSVLKGQPSSFQTALSTTIAHRIYCPNIPHILHGCTFGVKYLMEFKKDTPSDWGLSDFWSQALLWKSEGHSGTSSLRKVTVREQGREGSRAQQPKIKSLHKNVNIQYLSEKFRLQKQYIA